jgi:hypothetical protein
MNQHQSSFLRYAALAVILLGATAVACKPAAQASPGGSGGGNGGSGQGGSGGNSGGGNGGSAGNSTSSPQGGNAGASGGASSRGGSGGATTNVGGASGGSSNGGAGGGNSSNGGAGGASSSNGGASGGNSKGGAGGGSSNNGGAGGGTTTNAGGSTVAKTACVDGTLPADPKMPGYSAADHTKFQTQASGVVTNMSPTEMAQQMRGTDPGAVGNRNWNDIFRQTDNTTRKISGYTFRDGPRGVNLDAPINATSASHSNSTAFPVAMARGATFDTDLEFRIGQAMGDEMVAAKQTMLLAPTVNILRHPLWGRAQETYGEDTFLIGRMGTASVAGIQQYVAACVKHYAGNNIEKQRETDNATMDEQTLREIYARHFEMIIKDGGVACVMAAYNMVNGTKCTPFD